MIWAAATAGISGGFDYLVSEKLVAGVGMGYFKNHIDLDENVGSGTIDGFGGSLYGTYFTERIYLQGVFSYARNNYENTRQIAFGSL